MTISSTEPRYTAPEVVRMTGASYRQLDYWDRTGLVEPAQAAQGSGSQRRYSAADVVRLRVIVLLLGAGLSLQAIREIMAKTQPAEHLAMMADKIVEAAEAVA